MAGGTMPTSAKTGEPVGELGFVDVGRRLPGEFSWC